MTYLRPTPAAPRPVRDDTAFFSAAETAPSASSPHLPAACSGDYEHRRLQDQLDLGHQRLSALERANLDLQAQLAESSARLDRTEKRIQALLAAQARQRGDLPTQAHAAHEVIARDYHTFVEHGLHALARAAIDGTRRHPDHQPASLWLLGELTRALFEDRPTAARLEAALQPRNSSRFVLASRTERALKEATALWQRAEETRLPFRWDCELLPGAPLDPARQTVWATCDPALPVQYLIAPAYVVERRVYGRQQVLTGPSLPTA